MLWRILIIAFTLTVVCTAVLAQPLPRIAQALYEDAAQGDEEEGTQEEGTQEEGTQEETPASDQSETTADLQLEEERSSQTASTSSSAWPRVGRMPALRGHTGLFNLYTADSVVGQTFTMGLFGQYFAASDVVREGDDNHRFTGRLTLSYTITDYLEAFASLLGTGNLNNLAEPNLIQTQGDLTLGIKGFRRMATGLHAGLSLALFLLNGENSVGFDFSATSANLRALVTYSVEEVTGTPLLVHANLGYLLDNSANLFESELQRVERFAHEISDYDLVEIGLGVEVPLAYVTPTLEWTMGLPIGGSGLDCDNAVIPCAWDVGPASFPNTITLGIKGTPVQHLALGLGVDISLTTEEATGLPAEAPYQVTFGVAYHLDPTPEVPPPPVQPEVVRPAPQMAWILGEVVSLETTEPIGGALISYPGSDLTTQSTDTLTGRFRSYEFPANSEVTVQISHPAYQPRTFTRALTVGEDGIRIRLEPSTSVAVLYGRVLDVSGSPLPASIYLSGPTQIQLEVDPLTAEYEQQVDIGRYVATAVADGYTSIRSEIEVPAGRVEWSTTLERLPEGQVAVLRGDSIYLSGERISFVQNDDELESVSQEILDQVALLLDDYPDISLRVIAHTDDTGTLELTVRQAQAVVDYLTGLGVDPARLQAEGHGSEEPLFPNISNRNRMRNRRVELLFVQ